MFPLPKQKLEPASVTTIPVQKSEHHLQKLKQALSRSVLALNLDSLSKEAFLKLAPGQ